MERVWCYDRNYKNVNNFLIFNKIALRFLINKKLLYFKNFRK
jgi:hypothetical protein